MNVVQTSYLLFFLTRVLLTKGNNWNSEQKTRIQNQKRIWARLGAHQSQWLTTFFPENGETFQRSFSPTPRGSSDGLQSFNLRLRSPYVPLDRLINAVTNKALKKTSPWSACCTLHTHQLTRIIKTLVLSAQTSHTHRPTYNNEKLIGKLSTVITVYKDVFNLVTRTSFLTRHKFNNCWRRLFHRDVFMRI